jgi:hypothetical protein
MSAWSEREDNILCRAYADGLDDTMIVRILASNGINRTVDAVGSRRRRLCLTKNYGKHQHGIYIPKDQKYRKRAVEVQTPILPKTATPLKVLPDRRPRGECAKLMIACMHEARAAGATITTVGDLRAYVSQFELDIPRGVPRDVPINGPSRSLVGTHFSHCE